MDTSEREVTEEKQTIRKTRQNIESAYQLLVWAIGIFVALGTAVNGFTITQLVSLYRDVQVIDKRMVAIESSGLKKEDGANIWAEISKIRIELAKISVERQNQRIKALEDRILK